MSATPHHNWIDPLTYCTTHEIGDQWALLYSGISNQGSGNHSFLASHPKQVIQSGGFDALEAALSQSGRLYGYLSYELCHELESLERTQPFHLDLPELYMFEPSHSICWDHTRGQMNGNEPHPTRHSRESGNNHEKIDITSLNSNMSKESYLQKVSDTIEQIHAGQFYQANITRKFYGTFENPIDSFALFKRLVDISPSAFSSYIQMGDTAILSSSPEGFLDIDESGKTTVRPIKGTAKRGTTTAEDEQIRRALLCSDKDRAENLMIVDLMRNDLSRCSKSGSVEVESLNELHTYATIHQLISTISSQKADDVSVIDVIKACYPAGSMTGAPKIAAMNWCAKQEQHHRGVYSGAIGWIGQDSCDLSVVIRTLIIQGNKFEFQVGGGIVSDSDPRAEWEETLIKATAIAEALGIDMGDLSML